MGRRESRMAHADHNLVETAYDVAGSVEAFHGRLAMIVDDQAS
jgi:hypothetical protein